MPGLRDIQQVTAHGVLGDAAAVAVVPAAGAGRYGEAGDAGEWTLPGGVVRHGEHPRAAVARIARDVLDADVLVVGLRDVVADVVDLPSEGVSVHSVRVLYDLEPAAPSGPPVRTVVAGRPEVRLEPFAARALARLDAPAAVRADRPWPPPAPPAAPEPGTARFQRAGAYAVVVERGRILLSRFVGSGEWTLPGGGIDHGEDPRDAVRREVYEETGLELLSARLSDVDSVHFVGRAPDGRLEDFHGVRVVYTGAVAAGEPHVVEIDGTTDAAAWVPLTDLPSTRLTGLALHATAVLR